MMTNHAPKETYMHPKLSLHVNNAQLLIVILPSQNHLPIQLNLNLKQLMTSRPTNGWIDWWIKHRLTGFLDLDKAKQFLMKQAWSLPPSVVMRPCGYVVL